MSATFVGHRRLFSCSGERWLARGDKCFEHGPLMLQCCNVLAATWPDCLSAGNTMYMRCIAGQACHDAKSVAPACGILKRNFEALQ